MRSASNRIIISPVRIPKLAMRYPRDVFLLFAALNAMGYDGENNAGGMSAAREQVRNALSGYGWKGTYPGLAAAFKKYHPWPILNAIFAKQKYVKERSVLGRCLRDLEKFSKEPVVRTLWPIVKAGQARDARKLSALFHRETSRFTAFLGQPPREAENIIARQSWACWPHAMARLTRDRRTSARHERVHPLARLGQQATGPVTGDLFIFRTQRHVVSG